MSMSGTASATDVAGASRDRLLDGIRGWAIILVLLSHTWIVAPSGDWDSVTWLFASGDYAVSIFFVVSGFLATRSMLREQDRTGTTRPGVTWLRRWIRISVHVYPLVIVVLAATAARVHREGGTYMRLSVDADNVRGQRFYAKQGMRWSDDERIFQIDGDEFVEMATDPTGDSAP